MSKKRYIDENSIIDAFEIGDDFVTVYINSCEPGVAGSLQRSYIDLFNDILKDPNYHDPERFHKGDHPRGSNWRTWENKFACHFHFLGEPDKLIKTILKRSH